MTIEPFLSSQVRGINGAMVCRLRIMQLTVESCLDQATMAEYR